MHPKIESLCLFSSILNDLGNVHFCIFRFSFGSGVDGGYFDLVGFCFYFVGNLSLSRVIWCGLDFNGNGFCCVAFVM